MLKFQYNNNTKIGNFEEFILSVYVIIDELYKKYAPDNISKRRNKDKAKLSDAEIITISICGELIGINSENAWFNFVKKNYSHLFPNLCSRSRFNRTRRALTKLTDFLCQKLLCEFSTTLNKYFIVDSFPLAVCKFGRAHYCRSFRTENANYGLCPSKKEVYFGYKVHAMITLSGFITKFEITPASIDDRQALLDMIDGESNIVILADKGYVGVKLSENLKKQGICLIALKRSNSKNNWSKSFRQLIFKFRRRIETNFSQLSEQLNAQKVLAKTFIGLCTRLVDKVFGYNLCLILNHIFYPNSYIAKIKHLIF